MSVVVWTIQSNCQRAAPVFVFEHLGKLGTNGLFAADRFLNKISSLCNKKTWGVRVDFGHFFKEARNHFWKFIPRHS